jgi:hypothetical protein
VRKVASKEVKQIIKKQAEFEELLKNVPNVLFLGQPDIVTKEVEKFLPDWDAAFRACRNKVKWLEGGNTNAIGLKGALESTDRPWLLLINQVDKMRDCFGILLKFMGSGGVVLAACESADFVPEPLKIRMNRFIVAPIPNTIPMRPPTSQVRWGILEDNGHLSDYPDKSSRDHALKGYDGTPIRETMKPCRITIDMTEE